MPALLSNARGPAGRAPVRPRRGHSCRYQRRDTRGPAPVRTRPGATGQAQLERRCSTPGNGDRGGADAQRERPGPPAPRRRRLPPPGRHPEAVPDLDQCVPGVPDNCGNPPNPAPGGNTRVDNHVDRHYEPLLAGDLSLEPPAPVPAGEDSPWALRRPHPGMRGSGGRRAVVPTLSRTPWLVQTPLSSGSEVTAADHDGRGSLRSANPTQNRGWTPTWTNIPPGFPVQGGPPRGAGRRTAGSGRADLGGLRPPSRRDSGPPRRRDKRQPSLVRSSAPPGRAPPARRRLHEQATGQQHATRKGECGTDRAGRSRTLRGSRVVCSRAAARC
jgi:hypothetical protein